MTDKDSLYWSLRRENDAFLKKQQWWGWHYARGSLKSQRHALAREAEAKVAAFIRTEFDVQVYPTTNNCPFDLWVVEGDRAVRIEVKISLYKSNGQGKPGRGGRYQANIHHHDAELLVFIARNGRDWPFVIPFTVLGSRHNLAIWSYCPSDYTGQWSPYLNNWSCLSQALAAARPRARQYHLPKGEGVGG